MHWFKIQPDYFVSELANNVMKGLPMTELMANAIYQLCALYQSLSTGFKQDFAPVVLNLYVSYVRSQTEPIVNNARMIHSQPLIMYQVNANVTHSTTRIPNSYPHQVL